MMSETQHPNKHTHNSTIKPHYKNNFTTIEFRLLCSTTIAGGVIGHSGSVVKRLERETTTKIQVDPPVSSSSKERLIRVYGSPTVNRKIKFSDGEEVNVSSAQDGLIRVFDRMLEVEPPVKSGGGTVSFRLLVGPGSVVENVDKICGEMGAFVKGFRLPENQVPFCAQGLDHQVVEISGDSLAVKKALVFISRNIQQKTIFGITGGDKGASAILHPSMKSSVLTTDERVNEDVVAEVILKLICPYDVAGYVIGYKGTKVKALEEETGASIRFSAPDDNYNERVVTISALEYRQSRHSSAQNALVRVFNESISLKQKESVTARARLLIHPRQSGWLDVQRDSIFACITDATGATLELLEQKYAHVGVSSDEKIIQIDGEYPNVQTALFQLSWMLRESVFHTILAESNVPLLPHQAFDLPPFLRDMTTLTQNMKSCNVTEEVNNGSLPTNAQLFEFPSEACLSASMEHPRDLKTVKSGLAHGRGKKSVIVTNTIVEIAVRADVFTSIFTDDGSKLARIRTISGAKVKVQDPSSGGDGQVIISGTPEQTLAAQSLLQAFIFAAL